jgi:hypothetical protein
MLSSCGVAISSSTPTAVPPYIHYTPSEKFNIHLEFNYPSSWIFSEEKIQDTDIIFVGLGEPQLLTVPTRAPYESHGTPSDFGRVSIMIQPLNSDQTINTLFELYKNGHNNGNWVKVLTEYKIKIDGYNASVLESQINDLESYTSSMFERSTFFVISDQIYEITFQVAEKDRGGEFEKGYDYFFKSLKIVP